MEEQLELAEMLTSLYGAYWTTESVRKMINSSTEDVDQLWKEMAIAGCLGLSVPEQYGGSGGTLADVGVWHVEAGRALAPLQLHATIHLGVVLTELGTEAQKNKYLPDLCEGNLRGTVVIGQPNDAASVTPMLIAERLGLNEFGESEWAVSGELDYVLEADGAEKIFATARERDYGQPERTIGLLLDRGARGLTISALETTPGVRFQRLVLDRVKISEKDVMGGRSDRGLTLGQLRRLSFLFATMFALDMVGGGEAVLQQTVDYTGTRHQFGKAIGGFQAVQHMVADMHMDIHQGKLAGQSAVFWLSRDEAESGFREAAIAVQKASAGYRQATLTAHQLHGGMGYVLETDLHLWSERARVLSVSGGSTVVAERWLEELVLA